MKKLENSLLLRSNLNSINYANFKICEPCLYDVKKEGMDEDNDDGYFTVEEKNLLSDATKVLNSAKTIATAVRLV